MLKLTGPLVITLVLTSCSHTYYIVRHAEKAGSPPGVTMNTPDDPPLSDAGARRAETLKEVLKDKKITNIYSTNTKRTRLTAEPLSTSTGLTIQTYGPLPDPAFINNLKKLNTNTLIVGHSNTVDDVVNGLLGQNQLSDLADSEYDNLFIVKYKTFFGRRIKYKRQKY